MWKPAIAAGFVLLSGCAPKSAKPDPAVLALQQATAAAAQANRRVLEGCYTCLLEARDTYTRLLGGPLAEAVRPRLFEAALLVTLREKELALPFEGSFARATAAAAGLPATFEAARILAIVEAIPPEMEGWGVLPTQEFKRTRQAFAKQSAAELTWLGTAPLQPAVGTYLSLAVLCAEIPGPLRDRQLFVGEAGEPALLVYRRNTCGAVRSTDLLEDIRQAIPDFVETTYFLTRAMASRLALGANWRAFRELLEASVAAFPTSPAVMYVAGRGRQLLGSCPEALVLYERTITLAPRHEDAWLGRTMCFSFLGESQRAIDTASSLIELKSDAYYRDAYYWRAANHHHLKDLTSARADIDNAKRRGSTIEILTLAGIIEYEQDALDDARRDLQRAQQLSAQACAPTWYFGLVHIKRNVWPDAGSSFDRAMNCYRVTGADSATNLAGIERATEIDPDYREQQIASLKTAIVEARRQERASAMNAAMSFTNAGDLTKIETLLATASDDPALAPEIERLRGHIKEYFTDKR